ncbi:MULTISPECIES: hypothetical protein [unclassified Duganella]|uniref:hypothetical protein n=1 Tax=unclassified Duganella TaxID=2636909 RepID=UPI00088903B5|nr:MULTISPECIES: hypothetical protein [unclassified Duganella]SDF80570.1 hypothetical protein SAMN05216320_1011379 [Duganella sp. OV458]SDI48709.1 hypothetical protein SAMN05428973_10136 [Duganella sp. OV510]
MTVKSQTAVVYQGGRRRWFSLAAACRAEASSIANKFCDCEEGDQVTPPINCRLHADPVRRERLLKWLAARLLQQHQVEPVVVAAPEQRALAACRELVAAGAEVKRLSKLIGEGIGNCPLLLDPAEYGPKGPATHLSKAYAAEEIDNDHSYGTHKEWLSRAEVLEILSECPHCMAAHLAIQERKVARQRLGRARRAVSMIGRAVP